MYQLLIKNLNKLAIILNRLWKNFPIIYEHYISLVLIIKNEALDILEYIEYYRILGVQKFYIYDNNSTDNVKELLKSYIEKGIVEYIYYPGDCVQREAYRDVIQRCKNKTHWLVIVDADEYVVPVEKYTLREFLSGYKDCVGIGINCLIFDSNGHIKRPAGLCIENYTRTAKDKNNIGNHHIKSIVRPKYVQAIDIHYCLFKDGRFTVDENKQKIGEDFPQESWMYQYNEFKNSLTLNVNIEKIRINHYLSRSLEDYQKRVLNGYADQTTERKFEDNRVDFKEYAYDTIILKYADKLKKNLIAANQGK